MTPAHPLDPHHALTRRCDVRGSETGPLAGLRVGVKDHLGVAGVPFQDGTVPAAHTELVRRLLDAGAVVTGKTSMGSTRFGETTNPHDPAYSPGYSSAGSGAAVAAGLVDLAVGTDEAGSVRIPAAWCGIVAMKPSPGVVPAFEAMRFPDLTTAGPMTATVRDNATMLRVLSGSRVDYARDLGRDVSGLRIGVVDEAQPADRSLTRTLRAAARDLTHRGASIRTVSIPAWLAAADVILQLMGHVDTLPAELADGCRTALRTELSRALAAADVLLTATTVVPPHRLDGLLPGVDDPAATRLLRTHIRNTCPANLTGHPALSVPAGAGDDGLPIGLQVLGRPFDEATLYRVGAVVEASFGAG